jgi:hypothetical protein
VTGRQHHAHVELADLESVAIREQATEIAVDVERVRRVVEVGS